ncbi:MAG: DUF4136 domain-containing protein [Myxococcales bacterium]|nr:DUF4136 domain-containing protein [Myxococcales bacterium]MDH5306460.1 DUF4136 domain-containing protein [Myxococcales bacterium]MDH5566120.1 DUF4136 domain-containing protein [Myxococcales bacterium]
MLRLLARLLVAPIAFVGCVGIDVAVDHDPEVDFSKYDTFAQVPPPAQIEGVPDYTEVRGRQIQYWIASALEAKGYRRADRESADLLIAFTLSGEPRTDIWVEEYGHVEGAARRPDAWRAGGYGIDTWQRSGSVSRRDYVQGTLSIDVFDNAEERMIWHGRATADVYTSSEAQKTGRKAVKQLIERFPPEAR